MMKALQIAAMIIVAAVLNGAVLGLTIHWGFKALSTALLSLLLFAAIDKVMYGKVRTDVGNVIVVTVAALVLHYVLKVF